MKRLVSFSAMVATSLVLMAGNVIAAKESMDDLIKACEAEAKAEDVPKAEAKAFIQDCVDQKIQEDLSAPPGSYDQ